MEQRLCISSPLVLSTLIRLKRFSKRNRRIQSGVTFSYINFLLRTVVHYRTVSAVRTPPSSTTTTTGCGETPALCQIVPPSPAFPNESTEEEGWAAEKCKHSKEQEGENEPPTSVFQAVWRLQSKKLKSRFLLNKQEIKSILELKMFFFSPLN